MRRVGRAGRVRATVTLMVASSQRIKIQEGFFTFGHPGRMMREHGVE